MAQAAVINRASLSQQIRDALLERIVSGALEPGDRLIELKIAEEMQTSQAPVREALRELEAIGLIEIQRNRGARVRIIDDAELTEIYAVRAELEALAGELAARRDPTIAEQLVQIIDRMVPAAAAADVRRFANLNSEFHGLIVETASEGALRDIWKGLDVRARTHLNMSRSVADLQALTDAHRAIAEAIGSGDAAKARALSWEHVRGNAPAQLA